MNPQSAHFGAVPHRGAERSGFEWSAPVVREAIVCLQNPERLLDICKYRTPIFAGLLILNDVYAITGVGKDLGAATAEFQQKFCSAAGLLYLMSFTMYLYPCSTSRFTIAGQSGSSKDSDS